MFPWAWSIVKNLADLFTIVTDRITKNLVNHMMNLYLSPIEHLLRTKEELNAYREVFKWMVLFSVVGHVIHLHFTLLNYPVALWYVLGFFIVNFTLLGCSSVLNQNMLMKLTGRFLIGLLFGWSYLGIVVLALS